MSPALRRAIVLTGLACGGLALLCGGLAVFAAASGRPLFAAINAALCLVNLVLCGQLAALRRRA